jgi:hypothetical protein
MTRPRLIFTAPKINPGFMTQDIQLLSEWVEVIPLDLSTCPGVQRYTYYTRLLEGLIKQGAEVVFVYFVFAKYVPLLALITKSEGWLIEDVIWGRTIFLPPASGLSIRREVAMRCFPLPTHFRAGADRVLYYRCAAITKIKSIERSLAIYRVHNSNTSLGIDLDKSITIYKTTLEDIKNL